jgi:hypothetical protein
MWPWTLSGARAGSPESAMQKIPSNKSSAANLL